MVVELVSADSKSKLAAKDGSKPSVTEVTTENVRRERLMDGEVDSTKQGLVAHIYSV